MFKKDYYFSVEYNDVLKATKSYIDTKIEGQKKIKMELQKSTNDNRMIFKIRATKKYWTKLKHQLIRNCESLKLKGVEVKES